MNENEMMNHEVMTEDTTEVLSGDVVDEITSENECGGVPKSAAVLLGFAIAGAAAGAALGLRKAILKVKDKIKSRRKKDDTPAITVDTTATEESSEEVQETEETNE